MKEIVDLLHHVWILDWYIHLGKELWIPYRHWNEEFHLRRWCLFYLKYSNQIRLSYESTALSTYRIHTSLFVSDNLLFDVFPGNVFQIVFHNHWDIQPKYIHILLYERDNLSMFLANHNQCLYCHNKHLNFEFLFVRFYHWRFYRVKLAVDKLDNVVQHWKKNRSVVQYRTRMKRTISTASHPANNSNKYDDHTFQIE